MTPSVHKPHSFQFSLPQSIQVARSPRLLRRNMSQFVSPRGTLWTIVSFHLERRLRAGFLRGRQPKNLRNALANHKDTIEYTSRSGLDVYAPTPRKCTRVSHHRVISSKCPCSRTRRELRWRTVFNLCACLSQANPFERQEANVSM